MITTLGRFRWLLIAAAIGLFIGALGLVPTSSTDQAPVRNPAPTLVAAPTTTTTTTTSSAPAAPRSGGSPHSY
jgi:hypothetical protein